MHVLNPPHHPPQSDTMEHIQYFQCGVLNSNVAKMHGQTTICKGQQGKVDEYINISRPGSTQSAFVSES